MSAENRCQCAAPSGQGACGKDSSFLYVGRNTMGFYACTNCLGLFMHRELVARMEQGFGFAPGVHYHLFGYADLPFDAAH